MNQLCGSDRTFGPGIGSNCRSGFDFTLTFEESILGLLPQSIFLILAPVRLMTLRKRRTRVAPGSLLGDIKLVSSTLYGASTCALLVYWAQLQSISRTSSSVAAAAIELVGSFMVFWLSRLEHGRAVRPSHLLQLFLLIMLACDAVRLRTLFLMRSPTGLILTASMHVFLTGWMLLLESWDKAALFHSEGNPRPAPEDSVGLFAARFFTWLNRLFWTGYSKVLKPDDLLGIGSELNSYEIPMHFHYLWETHPHKRKKNAALWVLLKALRADLLRPVIPRLLQVGTEIIQPFIITRMVSFIGASPDEQSDNEGYGLMAVFGIVYILRAVFSSWARQAISRFQVQARACLITATYEHTLQISAQAAEAGSAASLMNVDVEKVTNALKFVHEYWAVTVEAAISLYVLWLHLGVIFVSPLIVVFIAIWLTTYIGKLARPRQRRWAEATQKRVTNVSQIAGSIKAIRMLGLNEVVLQSLDFLREQEVHLHKHVRKVALVVLSVSNLMVQFSTLASFIPFAIVSIARGGSFDLTTLFSSLSALKLFCTPLMYCMQTLVSSVAALASMDRIQEYLASETVDQGVLVESLSSSLNGIDSSVIRLQNASFGIEEEKPLLRNIELDINSGQLVMIIGKVASGKSVLLRSLIRETHLISGSCDIASGGIAYCPQSPWLRNTTLRANIIGQSDFDAKWYRSVVWACVLDVDFAQLKHGDSSHVGSQGVSLSGGQKNRVSLARALYSRKRLIVVDDMLAGLDNSTKRLVFTRIFGRHGIVRKSSSTVVLATHSVHHCHEADTVVVLDNGTIVAQGPYETMAASDEKLQRLDLVIQQYSTNDADEEQVNSVFEKTNPTSLNGNDSPSQAGDEQDDNDRRSGDLRGLIHYVKSIGKRVAIVHFILLILAPTSTTVQSIWLKLWASSNDDSKSAMLRHLGIFIGVTLLNMALLSLWTTQFFLSWVPKSCLALHAKQLAAFMHAHYSYLARVDTGSLTNRFSQDIVLVDGMLQIAWFNTSFQVVSITCSLVVTIVATYPVAVVVPFLGAVCWIIQRVYLRTSRQIRLMDLEAKAPLCTHFLETLAGVMSVRSFGWSQAYSAELFDLLRRSQVPLYLLYSIQNWLTLVLQLMVTGIVIVVVGSGVALRGKIDPGFLGLALIGIMDLSENLFHLVTMWTELETCLSAVSRILKFSSRTPQEPSAPPLSQPDLTGWPSAGQVDFRDVTASYSPEGEEVLRSISLSIRAGEKIGICGRTGSGKSSLVATLFGLLHQRPSLDCEILIDGVATHTVPLELLRSSIIALPQEPFFLPGTVRDNLVPWTIGNASKPTSSPETDSEIPLHNLPVSDTHLLAALDTVGLLSKLQLAAQSPSPSPSTSTSPLDLPLSTLTAVLSAGERQLFCLARATLLTSPKIVVLDEATSNVDRATDERMQRILREAFAGKTVIAIAHRLDTILDFDRVVVMEEGRVVEVGAPGELVEREGGKFRGLLEAQRG